MSFNRFLSKTQCSCENQIIYQKIVVIPTDGDFIIQPVMYGYEYILSSGTAQNFLTTVLTNIGQSAGFFIKLKNGKGVSTPDITISIDGVVAGTLHPQTNQSNAGYCVLYWNGSTLSFY